MAAEHTKAIERSLGRTSVNASAISPVAGKSIAVLAFRQHSADQENEYLCEAIADELCNKLGSVPGLKVAASASAFTFKGTKREQPAEMARQLGVAYLARGRKLLRARDRIEWRGSCRGGAHSG
mgnify:FL=1